MPLLRRVGGESGAPAVDEEEEEDADEHRDNAVPGPADVSSHEAAGEDVDALEDPDDAHEDGHDGQDVDEDVHPAVDWVGSPCSEGMVSRSGSGCRRCNSVVGQRRTYQLTTMHLTQIKAKLLVLLNMRPFFRLL